MADTPLIKAIGKFSMIPCANSHRLSAAEYKQPSKCLSQLHIHIFYLLKRILSSLFLNIQQPLSSLALLIPPTSISRYLLVAHKHKTNSRTDVSVITRIMSGSPVIIANSLCSSDTLRNKWWIHLRSNWCKWFPLQSTELYTK